MLTITAGLLALNPSIFAQAQSYDDAYYDKESYYKDDTYRYGYDHNDKKKDINIEKIICDNKKINIIGNLDVNPGDFATTTDAGEAIATGEENGETGSDSVTSNGLGDRKKFDNDKDLLVDCRSFNTNIIVGEPFPPRPPIEIEGCEGCFITAIANSPDPPGEAAKLILQFNTDDGIIITLGARNFEVHSLFELCTILDVFAITENQIEAVVQVVIDQAQLDLGLGGQQALVDCLVEALEIST